MIRALHLVFVTGCLLVLLIFAGPLTLLLVLVVGAVRMLVWERWENLERRNPKP